MPPRRHAQPTATSRKFVKFILQLLDEGFRATRLANFLTNNKKQEKGAIFQADENYFFFSVMTALTLF